MSAEIEFVWRNVDDTLAEQIITMWDQHDALPPGADAIERAKEVVVVARENGELGGVVTATEWFYKALRHNFALYRVFVAPAYRQGGLLRELARKMHDDLQAWSLENPDAGISGVASVREARFLRENRRKGFSPGLGAMLVGFNASGFPINVKWFDHIRV